MKPNITFTLFSHPPDLGRLLSSDGNMANNVNGSAMANEKPSITIAGASRSPFETASTNTHPIDGPVHENDTTTNVAAMNNMPTKPPFSEFASSLFANELGRVISNAPRNDMPKTISNKKKQKLNMPLVARPFKAAGPNMIVIRRPKNT